MIQPTALLNKILQATTFLVLLTVGLQAQTDPNFVDLGIRFVSLPPSGVKINQVFGVQAEVYLDANTTTVPAGETVTAEVTLVDPSGLIIQSHTQSWSGFNEDTDGNIVNQNGQLFLQVPWSQASKWTPTASWKIVLSLTASSVESDMTDNLVEQSFNVLLPDLSMSISNVTATDPLTGQETVNFVPNTNYTVSGTVSNIGEVTTQPSVHVSVVAQLRRLNLLSEGQFGLGAVMDEQSIVFPDLDDPLLYLPANGSWNFTIGNLFLPADASGQFVVTLEVNPADIPGGRVMMEQSYANNLQSFPSTAIDIDLDGTVDYYGGNIIEVGAVDENATSFPQLEFVPNSYNGEKGTFRGLDPAFISFAIRNNGTRPVAAGDEISASVLLSKDLQVDDSDFILREFDLGGNGIGLGMLAGETINLTWFQQLPDNFEGDYYLIVEMDNRGTSRIANVDTTPIFSLSSQGKGTTDLVPTDTTTSTLASERPSSGKDGRYVVYEKSVPDTNGENFQQIFLLDTQAPEAMPLLISKSFNDPSNQAPGNGSSLRPQISLDGTTVVFHSRASDLVPGDTNGKEDIFLYRVASNTLFRAVNDQDQQFNGRSLYPAVNGDGSKIVFESDATNAVSQNLNLQNQIFLWTLDPSGGGTITALTNGNGNSYNPSIDESGNRIVFDSFATNLLDGSLHSNGSTFLSSGDVNSLRDIYFLDLTANKIYLASLNFDREQSLGGASMLPKISGDGQRIVFQSKAQNFVSGAGIATVVVTEGGAGYFGTPSIELVDEGFNSNGAPGSGAVLTFKPDGINALNELKDDAILVINTGSGYIKPNIQIIPDPAFPLPTYEAKVTAYLSNPEGDVYYVDVADLNGSNFEYKYTQRVSQSVENQTGGNFGSREPSINYDGSKIVYSTKSSNLLPESINRDDGKTFYNSTFELPTASAVLVGSIAEIEIENSGSGYSGGFLNIEDLSGTGFGAEASYEVDQRGRIVSIQIINSGENYRLESTQISVAEPLGGSGFLAGQARFFPTQGLGETRSGGGRIYKVEMNSYGLGYKIGEDENASFSDLVQFEGDGADLNGDGFPDGRLNPDRVHNFGGSLYLEQKFQVEILSGSSGLVGADILNTTLTISDKNNTLEPLIVEFEEGAGSSGRPTISITLGSTTKSDIRNGLIQLIDTHMDIATSGVVSRGPVIENNQSNGSTFTFSALSGRFTTNNPSAVKVIEESNMLIMGSGYTTVTPVINQVPSIYGFSEIRNDPSFSINQEAGRMTLLAQRDEESDDIYLFDLSSNTNTRVSKSSFGTPAGYLNNNIAPSPPSNRFPFISGNGRFVFFSSDSSGIEGLSFQHSNQLPTDNSPTRSLFVRDLKSSSISESSASLVMLFPSSDLNHSFAPQSNVPVIADLNYSGNYSGVGMILNQSFIGFMNEFGGGDMFNYGSGRFTDTVRNLNAGEYSLQLVAIGFDGQILATSSIRRFTVSSFEGSLPPTVNLANPDGFEAVTSTSVIPLTVTGSDPDGALNSISYYQDGKLLQTIKRVEGIPESSQTYPLLFDINSTLAVGEERGVRSLFAIGVDNSGNYVATNHFSISFTKGTESPPSVSIVSGIMGEIVGSSDLNVTVTNGAVTSISLVNGPVGNKLLAARVALSSSGLGIGALFEPVVQTDPNLPYYGQITGFTSVSSGTNYNQSDSFSINIVPILRVVNEGVRAQLRYTYNAPTDVNQTTRTDNINVGYNLDRTTPMVGSGYVVGPRMRLVPSREGVSGWARIPLQDSEGPTSSIIVIPTINVTQDANSSDRAAVLVGGFVQSAVGITVEANASTEQIESVSLIINGGTEEDLIKTEPSVDNLYTFVWIPDEPGDYTVNALVRDIAGNVISTPESLITIDNFYGSGVNLSLSGDSNYTVEANSNLLLRADATSEFGISEVEFYINDLSVGVAYDNGGTSFQTIVDLSKFNLRQGQHEISVIARDRMGNMGGTFPIRMTNLKQRQNILLTINPPLLKNPPVVELKAPATETTIPIGSTLRLHADASDINGDLRGVQFYINQNTANAWSGYFDFNNSLPADGSTITIDDGTTNSPVTFEFDNNLQAYGSGAPVPTPGAANLLDDLRIEGNYTHIHPLDFVIEIDRVGSIASGTKDTFRWSKDGGISYVQEGVVITPGISQTIAYGLDANFSNANGHKVGDRWAFTARSKNNVVKIFSDSSSNQLNIYLTRNALNRALENARAIEILSIRSHTYPNQNQIHLNHVFDYLVHRPVSVTGSALKTNSGTLVYNNNDLDGDGLADNFILSQSKDSKFNEPFGFSWEANETGNFIVFAIAEDSKGTRVSSQPIVIEVVNAIGQIPMIELGRVEQSMIYSGSALNVSLSAEASDPDGSIAEVSFYGNGVLIESDSSRPYSANFEINATGHYEVYAVARDNSGNLVTSNVRRIIVDEGGEEPEQPLVLSAPSAYLGGVGEISGTYKSESGSYDSNIRALVYIDGSYAGDADLLPRTPPGPGEEDAGQSFTYDLLARNLSGYEVEFIIIDGNETASTVLQLEVKASPLSDDYEFMKALWNGLFDRNPESAEINAYWAGLGNGSITRSQVFKHVRTREEFISARDILLGHKTLHGQWEELPVVLENTDQEGYGISGVGGVDSAAAQAAMGMPYTIPEGNATDLGFYEGVEDDHANFASAGTWVTMNDPEVLSISNSPSDVDFFRIKSQNLPNEGVLTVAMNRSPFGTPVNGWLDPVLQVYFKDGTTISDQSPFAYGGSNIVQKRQWDLSRYSNVDYYAFYIVFRRGGANLNNNQFADLGGRLLTILNANYSENNENFLTNEEIAQLEIESRVNNFDLNQAFAYQTNNFSYTDQYGAIGTHNPEEFFTRLFRNKYEQDPSPVQIARGVELLDGSIDQTQEATGISQQDFLSGFALDNAVMSVGAFNYTGNLAIPNVPLDAAAFGETALVYSALIGKAPSESEVAKITLTPNYELRPMAERARMIMEMPAYAARYGLAMPEVSMPGVRNGREYDPGDVILIDATSLGADDLAGTADDGQVREIEVYLNGIQKASLSNGNLSTGTQYSFYQFTLPSDQPAGEYELEVVAEDIGGLRSSSSASITLRGTTDLNITAPVLGEVLYWDQNINFTYSANATVTTYLEMDGLIPWMGRLAFDMTDLPEDNATLEITDGTGKDAVVFEFDNDNSPGVSPFLNLVEMVANQANNLSVSGTYFGTETRSYFIEIDGNGTSNGNDTFRWSLDGGATFNDSEIEISAGNLQPLSSGVFISFTNATANEVGDRWRVKAEPKRHIVKIGSHGNFEDRLDTTKNNLIHMINQVANANKLAIRAGVGSSDTSGGGGFFNQNIERYSIELRHDGSYPIVRPILVNPDAGTPTTTLIYNEDLPLISATGDGSAQTLSLDISKWLAPGTSLVKTRIVAISDDNSTSYSEPRHFEVRNNSRAYVDLIQPTGRKAVLRFKESFVGDGLNASDIEIFDPGLGYDNDSVHLSFLTANGSGGELNATLDDNGSITALTVVSPGTGYAQGDVILITAPYRYRVGEEMTIRAKINDPLGELSQMIFTSNGDEIAGQHEIYGDEHLISFIPRSEQPGFLSARPFYGDTRDIAPRLMNDGSKHYNWSGQENAPTVGDWGWRRSWEQQHCHPGQYVAPPWYWGNLDGYWQWPPPWLSAESIPGGVAIQPLPSNVTAVLINPSPTDPSLNNFTLGVEVEIAVSVAAEVGTVEEVRLFLDGKLLDLELRFPQPVPGSPVGSYSRDGLYGFVWTPDRPGTYELTVQATDNAGKVSEFTELSKAVVVVGTETLGAAPIVRMTEPVPGGFGDTFPDYSYGSSLFVNVLAYDPDGDLEYVKIFLNGEELGSPQGRFGNTYVFKWEVATETAFFQNFVLQAVAKDNDGNVVRSGTLAGLIADNSANTRPTVNVDNVTVDNEGVKIRALAEINDNSFFGGISRVQFFINGVTLDAVGGQGTFFADGLQEYLMDWKPDQAGTYNIYAMAVGSVGQTGDHYTISEPFVFELSEDQLAQFSSPNAGPTIRLVSPGPHIENQAIARAHLDESLTAVDSAYGQVQSLSMVAYGQNYTTVPTVTISGGGGAGAEGNATLRNGAITRVSLTNGGKNYDQNLELNITTSLDFNGTGLVLDPVLRNGVITNIPVLSKGLGYKSSDLVGIFDLQNAVRAGYGGRASLEVDENGSITSINILDGGQNYNLTYLRVVVTGSGYGFEADLPNVTLEDGVINKIIITDPGSGYSVDHNYSIQAVNGTQGSGTGLLASISGTDIKDGVVTVSLTDNGQGYVYEPSVILTGGSSTSFASPFVFTQGSIVTLEAEVEDLDGYVEEVRFYGNGQLLGNNPQGGIESLTIVSRGNPNSFSEPPVISFIGGGAGVGAVAQASIDENGTLTGVQITSPGVNYTSPPAVVISPSNGVLIAATVDTEIRNNARNIPGTNRWVADWNTRFSGTYNLSVEAIDDESKSTRVSTERYVTVLPKGPSKAPRAILLGPPDLNTFTSGSRLKLFAQASDPDGSLEWVQFYVNGEPYGDPITGNLERSSARFPYSLDWVVPESGVYSFFARVMDNSGNGAMTGISTITATTGTGKIPEVEFQQPLRVAHAEPVIDNNGSISDFIVKDGGFGYVKVPEVYISGGDGKAVATVKIDQNNSSPFFGQVIDINVTNGGSGYDQNSTMVALLKGFPLIKPGGESATVEVELELIETQGTSGRQWQPTFNILDGGTGYTEAPTVVIEGLGTGMTADAVIDPDRGILTAVNPTNNGDGYYQTGNRVTLEGGFPLEVRTFRVRASDEDGSVVQVTLFVNGAPLQVDRFPPYEFQWPSGAAGYYDVYFEVLDNQGNRNVSSVMRREVFYSEAPEFEFQPASHAVVSDQVDVNGSWELGALSPSYVGTGYHSPPNVVFFDPQQTGSGASGYAKITGGKVTEIQITNEGNGYSQGSEIRLIGGLNTALDPIRMELGKTLPLTIYAHDPDSMINPVGFVLEVNGEEMDTLITGSDPYFSFLWSPDVPGDYDIRVRGSSVDGTEAYTQNLDVEVYNDSENSVALLIETEGYGNSKLAIGDVINLPFEINSKLGTVEEIRIFDNGVEVGSYPSQQMNNLSYEPGSGFFNFAWVPNYLGVHDITVSVKLQSGLYIFSNVHSFEAVNGLSISIVNRSPGLDGYKLHMQSTSVIVEVDINQSKAPQFAEAYLYGNDKFIKKMKFFKQGIEQPSALDMEESQIGQLMIVYYQHDPIVSTLEWNFDWNVSYKNFKDDVSSLISKAFGGGDPIDVVEVNLKVIAVTKEDATSGTQGRVITSETKPAYVRVLDINKPVSASSMIYREMTGESATDEVVRDLKASIPENTDEEKMLEILVNYSIGEDLVPMADLAGAYAVLFGEVHPTTESFEEDYGDYGDNLLEYIRDELQSTRYVSRYGPIYTDREHFFGIREGDYFANRTQFVSRHFINKFGVSPTVNQYTVGANKLWNARQANLNDNLTPAVDFIYNLVVEPTRSLGLSGFLKETYLPFMNSVRGQYLDTAKQFILLKNLETEGEGETEDEGELRSRRLRDNFDAALDAVLSDPSFKEKFNLLWDESPSSNISSSWKNEEWFGWFTDETFPWIYHTDLGWLYSTSNSQNSIWFFSEQFGWFWTNKDTFKDHSNLTENQRFIYRVRSGNYGGWEGTWSLVTLPSADSGSSAIHLYDYGYSPL